MLPNTFRILDRIGPDSERAIISQGIDDWDSFLRASSIRGISRTRKLFYDRRLKEAKRRLASGDAHYFSELLAPKDRWRLWPHFKQGALFLDIETSEYYGDITVVGISDGETTRQFVKGRNLEMGTVRTLIGSASLLVTFNGESYDLRVLERYHPGTVPPTGHLDLRYACQQAGLAGGLKSIERQLSIPRDGILDTMVGEDAIYLWNAFVATNKHQYLERLLKYNAADCENLLPLADQVYRRCSVKYSLSEH